MADFEVVRRTHIAADPARVHGLVNDFRQWRDWSPWEGLDPTMDREYSGAERGVGAHYTWSGNRRAGSGSMEITASNPQQIDLALTFEKPWRATNRVCFLLTPVNSGTDVAWRMTGSQSGVAGLLGRVVGMDRLLGKDFEKGLTRLKAVAES
ncbi:MAG TPA: SRPBCC family protein [Nocardioides sp.]|uniref:SRPBCC family protein n=1 Tax=Nocardioides sp. TaxID=35761 RepID=UPI002BC4376E|nr:SRPBCC family protein [Nocardioides sp.]HQR26642.1 SRPBCC family protein [Nocardioides sp.]